MEKKLEVKNLKISFRTNSGKVQAVRDISFDLNKGETLAIVGESGSGKSVTSKAIMGILAGNSIVEGGEILYEGQDLLKIDEEDFHKIRGNKISMIFQDPMSSLNPIMKIGRQLTEAMILKGAARQREAKVAFNAKVKLLKENLLELEENQNEEQKAKVLKMIDTFNKFEAKHIELERTYNESLEAANNAVIAIEEIVLEIEKKQFKNPKHRLGEIVKFANKSVSEYVVNAEKEVLLQNVAELKSKVSTSIKEKDFTNMIGNLKTISNILENAKKYDVPNFFALGYRMVCVNEPLPQVSVKDLNELSEEALNNGFLNEFFTVAKKAVVHSTQKHNALKLETVKVLRETVKVFEKETLDKVEVAEAIKTASEAVAASIDHLELLKDSKSYTFAEVLKSLYYMYFKGAAKNVKEIARYEKENATIEKMIAKGKNPEWKPIPPAIIDLELTKENLVKQFVELANHLEVTVENNANLDFDQRTEALIQFLKDNASAVVNKVTKHIAKQRAIKVMEEVGIPEAHKRYYQYPFQFSGGMRQRIVIAIALASNPDILICDEPTTALDVTIQANILELINKLKRERNLSIIFITHDLGVVANMADRVAVMYAGKVVEYGSSEDIFYDPKHPYTWALLSSMPDLETKSKLEAIPGTPPNMIYPPKGDAFAARNRYAMEIDFEQQPPMYEVKEGHYAATWLLHPDAPKVNPPKIVTDRIKRMKEADVDAK